jgi:hypothetical protein
VISAFFEANSMKAQFATTLTRRIRPPVGTFWLLPCVVFSGLTLSGPADAQPEAIVQQGAEPLSERIGGYTVIRNAIRTDALPEIVANRPAANHNECGEAAAGDRQRRLTWAQRLKRIFAIDIEVCRRCGGKLRVIASI